MDDKDARYTAEDVSALAGISRLRSISESLCVISDEALAGVLGAVRVG